MAANLQLTKPWKGGSQSQGVFLYFHAYVGSGNFFLVQKFEFEFFFFFGGGGGGGGVSENKYFCGYDDFVVFYFLVGGGGWGHHKIGLYLGVIS